MCFSEPVWIQNIFRRFVVLWVDLHMGIGEPEYNQFQVAPVRAGKWEGLLTLVEQLGDSDCPPVHGESQGRISGGSHIHLSVDLQSKVKKRLNGGVDGVFRRWVDSVRDGALFQLIFSEMVNDFSRSVWNIAINGVIKGASRINLGVPGVTLR